MNSQIRKKAKRIALLFAVIYFASYIMRINFNVMLVKICSDMMLPKTALAVVVTGLTVTYGIGQIISGFLGDKINPRYLLTGGLLLAVVCNVCMFFCQNVSAMTVTWCVNGFAHALFWPPIVRLMSTYLTDTEYGYAAVRVSWGSSVATMFLYLICPLLLYILPWRVIVLLCAAVGLGVMILWLLLGKRLLDEPLTLTSVEKGKAGNTFTPIPVPKFVYIPVALIIVGIIMQGILRDGVTYWMPSYLAETFHISEENSIISTVILAVFSIISFAAFDLLHRKVFQNEVMCAAAIFGGSAVASLLLYLANAVLAGVLGESVVLVSSMVLMALVVGSMHGINLMLITVVPKRFIKSGKVSTYSGVLNACTYVGAALSSYGFAALAEQFGWNVTILSWIAVATVGFCVCLGAVPLWERFKRI